jgi:hypothetical protein
MIWPLRRAIASFLDRGSSGCPAIGLGDALHLPTSAIGELHFEPATIRAFVPRRGQYKSTSAGVHQPGNCKIGSALFRLQLQGRVVVENDAAAAIHTEGIILEIVHDLKFVAVCTNGRRKTAVIKIR